MRKLNNIEWYKSSIYLTKKCDVNRFIELFCNINKITIQDLNQKKKHKMSFHYLNHKGNYIATCKFVLYFIIRHKYDFSYDKIAKTINIDSPVNRVTAKYYIQVAEDLLVTNNYVAKDVFETTLKEYFVATK